MTKIYILLGIILSVVGLSLTIVSYFGITSIPLTALGISIIILGFTSIALAITRQRVSSEDSEVSTNHILILSLAMIFGITDILLMLFNQKDLAVYFVINAIIYFIAVSFYVAINPKFRNALTAVGAVIFTVFMFIIVFNYISKYL